jgi:predicted site-specific integrase-resolvase
VITNNSIWLPTPEAARALGISISTLYRWRSDGLLKPGHDWRRKYPSANSPVLYHIERCEERMAALTATSANSIEAPLFL